MDNSNFTQPQFSAGPPVPVPMQASAGNGLAIASMVLGIVAILTGFFYIGFVLGILAIIFGIIALKKRRGKGMAIAGIITGSLGILGTIASIALVWMAVPAIQSSARDVDRKNELMSVVSQVEDYQSANQGRLPDSSQLSIEGSSPENLKLAASGTPTTETVVYQAGTNCSGTASEHDFSVSVMLEHGGLYCQGS